MKTLFFIFAVVAVVAIGQSAIIDQSSNTIDKFSDEPETAPGDAGFGTTDGDDGDVLFDDDDDDDDDGSDEEDSIDPETEVDGIPLKLLSKEEIRDLLDEDDNVLASQLDILAAAKQIKARQATDVIDQEEPKRQKRWVPLAVRLFQAGRALFRASRVTRVTTSGSRVTRQYARNGNYRDAVRDFNRFQPSNQRTFTGRVSGRTGTVGNHRVTVRDGSRSGRPTLEIRSPGDRVRKFRYNTE